MRRIIYYVATSLDGYIAGKNGDISMFIMEGDGVEQYHCDLQDFDTVIMGRKTYEFGYDYGLKPGQPAYPNMTHHIFSNTMKLVSSSQDVKIEKIDLNRINDLKNQDGGDIYLCGGGVFAGWLMKNQMIDELKLKINPILIGEGTPLFGGQSIRSKLSMTSNRLYDDGMQIVDYRVINN